MRASSMNFIGCPETKKPYRSDRAFSQSERSGLLCSYHAHHVLAFLALDREHNLTGDFRKQGVVLAHADVRPRVHAGAALADDDAACGDQLAAERLHPEALGLRVAAVPGTAACFLVCHE